MPPKANFIISARHAYQQNILGEFELQIIWSVSKQFMQLRTAISGSKTAIKVFQQSKVVNEHTFYLPKLFQLDYSSVLLIQH